jgi:hypothetical protein
LRKTFGGHLARLRAVKPAAVLVLIVVMLASTVAGFLTIADQREDSHVPVPSANDNPLGVEGFKKTPTAPAGVTQPTEPLAAVRRLARRSSVQGQPGSKRVRAPRSSDDWGVDKAIANRQIWIYAQPATSDGVRTLRQGDTVVLISHEEEQGRYNVFDLTTGKDGWVNADEVTISYTQRPQTAPTFAQEYVGHESPPSVIVKNHTGDTMTLKFAGKYYTVAAGNDFSLSIESGPHSFWASVPRAIPVIGTRNFERGYRYEWTFWIETRTVPVP